MAGKIFRGARMGAACAAMLGCLAAGGCSGRGGDRIVRVDSLSTDRERLMLVRYLPPGMEESNLRLSLPGLGPANGATGIATQPFSILGQAAVLEVGLRNGVLESCGYRVVCADSGMAAFLYRELQRTYTAELGNYHEEFADAARPARSFWSSSEYALALTLSAGADGYTLAWRFTALPRTEEPPAPAAENSSLRPARA